MKIFVALPSALSSKCFTSTNLTNITLSQSFIFHREVKRLETGIPSSPSCVEVKTWPSNQQLGSSKRRASNYPSLCLVQPQASVSGIPSRAETAATRRRDISGSCWRQRRWTFRRRCHRHGDCRRRRHLDKATTRRRRSSSNSSAPSRFFPKCPSGILPECCTGGWSASEWKMCGTNVNLEVYK